MNLPVNMVLAFFLNNSKKIEMIVKGVSGKSGFFFNCIAYWYCLLAPVIPLWKNIG